MLIRKALLAILIGYLEGLPSDLGFLSFEHLPFMVVPARLLLQLQQSHGGLGLFQLPLRFFSQRIN